MALLLLGTLSLSRINLSEQAEARKADIARAEERKQARRLETRQSQRPAEATHETANHSPVSHSEPVGQTRRTLDSSGRQASSHEGMILIPAGEFLMGSLPGEGEPDEYPQHSVYLDAFYIDEREVTNQQFCSFLNEAGNRKEGGVFWVNVLGESFIQYRDGAFVPKPGHANHPVTDVSWYGARAYARWAGKRLPTEAEWQKAARGVDGRRYPWGNELPSEGGKYLANYDCYDGKDGTDPDVYKRDGYEHTSPVGSYENGASPYGVLDMAGNVWEWCADWYGKDYYRNSPSRNPLGPKNGQQQVVCGGSWYNNDYSIRSAKRQNVWPNYRNSGIGFRCALDAE